MKKLISAISSLFFVTIVSAKAEFGVGVTGAFHMLDASGTETTRHSSEKNNGSHDETVFIPELFVEKFNDNGTVIGLSYIPVRDMDSKSRSDSNSDGDTGTYKAAAELNDVIQVYTDIPVAEVYGYQTHVKLGFQRVTLETLESLNSGSSYPNEDLFGFTLGYGVKGDLTGNMYYKGEVTYTNFEQYEATSNGNRIEADLDDYAAKFSIGYKF